MVLSSNTPPIQKKKENEQSLTQDINYAYSQQQQQQQQQQKLQQHQQQQKLQFQSFENKMMSTPSYQFKPIQPKQMKFSNTFVNRQNNNKSNKFKDFNMKNPSKTTTYSKRKKRTTNINKSNVAKKRRRDCKGHFLSRDVAIKLDHMEKQVEDLQQVVRNKDLEIKQLKHIIEEKDLLNKSLLETAMKNRGPPQESLTDYYMTKRGPPTPQQMQQSPIPIHNYSYLNNLQTMQQGGRPPIYHRGLAQHSYVPLDGNVYQSTNHSTAFQKQIDFSKIQLRAPPQKKYITEDEKKEIIYNETQWEEEHRLRQFISNLEHQGEYNNYNNNNSNNYNNNNGNNNNFSHTHDNYQSFRSYGGPPSKIYGEFKLENQNVDAFKKKIDYSKIELCPTQNNINNNHNDNSNNNNNTIDQHNRKQLLDEIQLHFVNSNNNSNNYNENDIFMENFYNSPNNNNNNTNNDQDSNLWLNEMIDDDYVQISNEEKKIRYGGPPSNIYTPPNKIGNRLVPAFTSKVDFSNISLKNTDSPYSTSPPL